MSEDTNMSLLEANKALQLENERLEDQLKRVSKMSDQYHTIFESIFDMVFLYTVTSDKQMSNFIEVNNRVAEVLGYTKEEMTKNSLMELAKHSKIRQDMTIEELKKVKDKVFVEELVKKTVTLLM